MMKKLSKHYIEDGGRKIDEETKNFLDENYLHSLKNINCSNRKMVVVFSGGNAVGKSFIANKIETEFKALVLENDQIKNELMQMGSEYSNSQLCQTTWDYSIDLYKRLEQITNNGLIVRDGIIDWYFDRVLPIFEKNNYPLFIIGFDVSKSKAAELIHNRGDTTNIPEIDFYELISEHELHTRRFRSAYTPDITLTDKTLFDYKLVLKELKNKLEIIYRS